MSSNIVHLLFKMIVREYISRKNFLLLLLRLQIKNAYFVFTPLLLAMKIHSEKKTGFDAEDVRVEKNTRLSNKVYSY